MQADPDRASGTERLTPAERLSRALAGQPVDRLPISLWRHFPVEDQSVAGLAGASLRWQRRFGFDLVKFMPHGNFSAEDWGLQSDYIPSVFGTRRVLRHGISCLSDWEKLRDLDPGAGCLGLQVEALRRVAEGLDGEVPLLLTAFSPLTTALKLAGQEQLLLVMREAPELLEAALATITRTTIRFIGASVAAGADGLFFATQCADATIMSEADYRRFGRSHDLAVLGDPVAQGLTWRMLHIHGTQTWFDLLAAYPVTMLNWHDRMAGPPLAEVLPRFKGLLAGGINEEGPISGADTGAALDHLDTVLGDRPAPRLMIAPGCSLTLSTSDQMIDAMIGRVRQQGAMQARQEVIDAKG